VPPELAVEKALSFNPLVPNKEIVEAMKVARHGELTPVASIADLFKNLDSQSKRN
jgi:hypothetical protein